MSTPTSPASPLRVLVVAVEESPPGVEALRLAQRLAAAMQGAVELHLTHVARAGAADGSAELEKARVWLLRTVADVASAASVVPHLLRGDPAAQIRELCRALPADLLVVGSHGRTGLRRLVLGSVAESLTRTAPCPVLVARPDADLLHAVPDDAGRSVVPAMTSTLGGAVAGAAVGSIAGLVGAAAGAALGAGAGGALGFAAGESQREADRRDSLLDEVLLGP
jgi:nucleotide-binding universal stress UspA family protein